MGEIANDMIEGRCCSLCGCYFEDPGDSNKIYDHGYPVICKDCWEPNCGYQCAEVDTI